MDYWEFSFEKEGLTSDITEILIAILADAGFDGFEENDFNITAFIPENKLLPDIHLILDSTPMNGIPDLKYSIIKIPEQNWNERWEKSFSPVEIENRILIKAPFHIMADLEYTIIIEPKMSFGTGHHETTRLMLREMLQTEIEGKEVLDMGCGTGILGIAARMMGASYVLAVDIDEWAHYNCIENFQLNNIRQPYDVFPGDSSSLEGHSFHIILANINRNILINDLPVYYKTLKEHGTLIMSGILSTDKDVIMSESEKYGFTFVRCFYENNWISLNLRK